MVFTPKTLDVIGSLSKQEQLYLYQMTREYKKAAEINDAKTLAKFKARRPHRSIYEVFLEDSTRTKESFRNAIAFHDVKGHMFDASSSSFNKHESYADTFNMLTWYGADVFIVRSKLEWVCTWLSRNWAEYAERHGREAPPIFINAWDGKHEHPTQELLDQFTFLEQNNFNSSAIHVALIWDLLHGRTVHSKVDGLAIFESVVVDLIAPKELQLQEYYVDKMKAHWYEVRIFESIDAYLDKWDVAPICYFTRLQLERMWDKILKKEDQLRAAVTIRKEHLPLFDDTTKFYHPLPRHKVTPVLPSFLDTTTYNGWEQQSSNWVHIRTVLLSAMLGVEYVMNWFEWTQMKDEEEEEQFVFEAPTSHTPNTPGTQRVHPIHDGITIDHIEKWKTIQKIRKWINKIISVIDLHQEWWERVAPWKTWVHKWIIFRPWVDLNEKQIRQLAALSPGCTLNKIKDWKIWQKLRLHMPPKLYNFAELSCKNDLCISNKKHYENVPAEFEKYTKDTFICQYCSTKQTYEEVWEW